MASAHRLAKLVESPDPYCVLDDSMGQTTLVGKGRFVGDPSIRGYCGKMRQANKEARATVIALACIVVVWLVGGFGLAGSDIQVDLTLILACYLNQQRHRSWIIGGCVAPWIAAIVAAVVLSRRVFVDFDLDDDASTSDEACEEVARHE